MPIQFVIIATGVTNVSRFTDNILQFVQTANQCEAPYTLSLKVKNEPAVLFRTSAVNVESGKATRLDSSLQKAEWRELLRKIRSSKKSEVILSVTDDFLSRPDGYLLLSKLLQELNATDTRGRFKYFYSIELVSQ